MKNIQLIALALLVVLLGKTTSIMAGETPSTTAEQAGEKHHPWHKRWENMSPGEQETYRAKREAMREKVKAMSPDERKAFIEKRRQEKLANMTPEQRKAWKEKHRLPPEQRQKLRKYMESLSPDDRREFRKKMHEMTPEERRVMIKGIIED